ncbi:MAG: ATP-binding protein, partial [bacterium]|nr:ATP-binding protein [bacterium]
RNLQSKIGLVAARGRAKKKEAWVEPGRIERQEKWEYPPDAIREAITNAVCHRDYFSNGNVQIRIFDDRIEIWNPGTLPEGLTIEDLKGKHESKPRNKLIARLFFLIKYIEEWGTGTNEMIELCLNYDLPEPKLEEIAGSFVVTFRKSKLTEESLESMELNERQRKIVEYLKKKKKITNVTTQPPDIDF